MSGGEYGYFYAQINSFVDDLRRRNERVDAEVVRAARAMFADHLERASLAAYAIEWVDSGDWKDGKEMEALSAYFAGFSDLPTSTAKSAAQRLREAADVLDGEKKT